MSNEERINKILEEIVPCQDCGGYVSDHNGVQGDCNYEAGTEIVEKAKAELTKLIDEETTKARIDGIRGAIPEKQGYTKAELEDMRYGQSKGMRIYPKPIKGTVTFEEGYNQAIDDITKALNIRDSNE